MEQENQIYELAAKKLSGDIEPDEYILLSELISQSTENKEIFREISLLWKKSDRVIPSFSANTQNALNIVHSQLKNDKRFSISKFSKIAALLILLFSIPALLYYFNSNTTVIKSQNKKMLYTLSDGTKVWLNKNSQISFNKHFNKKIRQVDFSGEAYFIVNRDTAKPFIIRADKTCTQVLGTEFNIINKNNIVKVDLTKGKVKFTTVNKTDAVYLTDKQSFSYDLATSKFTNDNVYNVNKSSWLSGVLKFENTELEQVAKDLSQHYDTEIRVEKSIRNLRFSTTNEFKNEKLENILTILSLTLNIKVQNSEGVIILQTKDEKD